MVKTKIFFATDRQAQNLIPQNSTIHLTKPGHF